MKRKVMNKIKKRITKWIWDKKNWLMTFNKRPSVIINQDIAGYEDAKCNHIIDSDNYFNQKYKAII